MHFIFSSAFWERRPFLKKRSTDDDACTERFLFYPRNYIEETLRGQIDRGRGWTTRPRLYQKTLVLTRNQTQIHRS